MTESDQQPLRQVSIAGVLASILSSTVTFCAEIVMHTIFKIVPVAPMALYPEFGSVKGFVKMTEDFDEPWKISGRMRRETGPRYAHISLIY